MLNRDNVPEVEPVDLDDLKPDGKADNAEPASARSRLEILAEIIRIFIIVLAGSAGLFFYLSHEHQVFPAASIELKCSKSLILETSRQWARKVGYDKQKTIRSIYFSDDDEAKTFLEYEFGTAKANALMLKEVPVWSWETRICQEFQDEEYTGSITPDGKPLELQHHIPNDQAIPSLTQEKAEALAREFVEKQIGISLQTCKSVEKSTDVLAHRTDHDFTWQDEAKEYNGGHLRISVTVSGNAVSYYNRYLHVPEKWDRKFSTVRTYNQLLATIAGVFSNLLEAAAAIAFVLALSSGNIRWRVALVAGAIFASFGFLESLNNLSTINASYDTTRSYLAFLLQHLLTCCLSPFWMFIYGASLTVTGEYIYRRFCPDKPALERTFSVKGLTSGSVLLAILLGYALCCFDMGWTATYYLVGYKIGFWCPLGVENFQTLSSYFPFLAAMYTGLSAASMEEIIYRVVGICLVQRLVKNFWLANLIQAVIWAFMHSTYPQQPCYARGIELTFSGMVYGWIFKRYGLLPCFISHYLYDAYCGVRPLLTANTFSAGCSAAIPLVPFALLGLAGLLLSKRTGHFVASEEIANKNIPIVKRDETKWESSENIQYEYVPLQRRWKIVLVCGAIAGTACMAFAKGQIAENVPVLNLNRHEALVAARNSLDKRRISRQGMYEVTTLAHRKGYSSSLQYIFEKSGFKKTAEYNKDLYLGYVWTTRFFKPMDSLEYKVNISGASGKELEFIINCEEDASGAKISEKAAQKLAEDCLRADHPEYCPFVYDSSTETEHKNRTDHSIVFKVPKYKVGEADFKASVDIVGNSVSSVYGDWSIPAKWSFEYYKTNTKDEIVTAIRKIAALVFGAALLWWGIGIIRSGIIRWKEAALCAIPLSLLVLVPYVNSLPIFYNNYTTTEPLSNYISTKLLGYGGGLLGSVVGNVLTFGFSLAVLRLLFPRFPVASLLQTTFNPSGSAQQKLQQSIWLDAVIGAYCMVLIQDGRAHLFTVLSSFFSPSMHTSNSCASLCSVPDYYNYLLSNINITYAVTYCFFPLVLMSLYAKYIKKKPVLMVLIIAYALLSSGTERYWQDFVIESISTFASLLLLWFFTTRVARTNFLTYTLLAIMNVLIYQIAPFIRFGIPVFMYDTAQIVIFVALPIAFLIYLFCRQSAK